MAFLENLSVKKVSFVNRAANKRKFLLLKSDDGVQTREEEQTEESTMKDEIRKSVRLLLKSGASDEKIVETLKAEFSLNDGEITEVKNAVEFARVVTKDDPKDPKPPTPPPTPNPPPTPPKTPASTESAGVTKAELDAAREENAALVAELRKTAETNRKREINIWLSENCAHLPADPAKLVDDIYKMEKADPEAATRYMDSLKQSSDMVKSSALLTERGSNFDAHPVPSGEVLLQKAKEAVDQVRKGDSKVKESDAIIAAVNSVPGGFKKYREEHIRRARLLG